MLEKLTTKEAAEYLGLKPGTLDIWRCTKHTPAPAYTKIGRKVYYLKRELDAYIESQTVRWPSGH